MPVVAMFIAPLLAMYVKFRLVSFAVKIVIFLAIYKTFQMSMSFIINLVISKMSVVQFPCMVSYIVNSLDIFPMINFALSVFATIYVGKFLLNMLQRLI